jgi:hypothetical protein
VGSDLETTTRVLDDLCRKLEADGETAPAKRAGVIAPMTPSIAAPSAAGRTFARRDRLVCATEVSAPAEDVVRFAVFPALALTGIAMRRRDRPDQPRGIPFGLVRRAARSTTGPDARSF